MFGLDEDGQLTFATPSLASQLGGSPASLAGAPLDSVVVGGPDTDLERVVDELRTALTGQVRTCDGFLQRAERPIPARVEFTATDGPQVVGTVSATGGEQFRYLFEQSKHATVAFEIIGGEPIVQRINVAFVETFGYSPATIIGESLNEYIVPDKRAEEAAIYDRRTERGETNHGPVTRTTVHGRRDFLYHGISYTAGNDRRFGFAVYTDVTDDQRRRTQLRVLHRVLRHNLRNDLSVVIGVADYILDRSEDPELERLAEKILEVAERLSSISEQARGVETALDSQPGQTVDAAAVTRAVVAEYDAVEQTSPAAAPVAGGAPLYDAVDNLVENAVVHTPADTDVWVTVDSADGETFVRVADHGPGIPENELAAVFENESITKLSHGSGLGLWLARWVAEAAGGELRYDRIDGATAVTMCLPRAEADAGDILVPCQDRDDDQTTGGG